MRIEFDESGYVVYVLYGCETGNCVEYTGLVPSEPEAYTDLDDWADRALTQAYKLNDQGNLVYDADRAAALTPSENYDLGVIDVIYPVGSIYMSVNNVSPEVLFGGSWERIEDMFLLAAGSAYEAGTEGGAENYALSVSHKHTAPIGYDSDVFGGINVNGTRSTGNGKAYRTTAIDYSGTLDENVTVYYTSDATVKDTIPTMPPYLAVFVWTRIA